MRRGIYLLILIICLISLLLLASNLWVIFSSRNKLYHEMAALPKTEVAIVLGTSRLTVEGEKNLFYEARMDKTAELFLSHIIDSVLVSGDNDTQYYNEPRDMSRSLVERGVAPERILKDAGGLRTYDSFYRLKQVYGKEEAIVVTQRFHAYRAVYIAEQIGINVAVYVADNPPKPAYLVYLREWIARPLAIWDLHIADSKPKYTD